MCLAIPAKIIELMQDNKALVDIKGLKLEVSNMLLPEVKVGEYVLVHAGFIIERMSEKDAEEGSAFWDEINKNDKR